MWFRLRVCCLLVILSGCVTSQPELLQDATDASAWRLQGKLSIKTGQGSRMLNIDWRQQGEAGKIALSAPLGVGVARIETRGNLVTVTSSQGVYTYTDDRPLRLKGLGEISLPWFTFAQWLSSHLTSLPPSSASTSSASTSSASTSSASTRVPSKEATDLWNIQLLHRDETGPRLIQFTHPGVTVKLKITAWSNSR